MCGSLILDNYCMCDR